MTSPLKKMLRHTGELEKNSMILFVVMMSGNFLNYLFQIFMGRQLQVEEYGQLSALLSIISILGVISLVVTMITAKYTVQYEHRQQASKLRHLVVSMILVVSVCSGAIIVLGFICSPWIGSALKISNHILVLYSIVAGAVCLFSSVVLGILQGLKRFFHYGIMNLLAILGKLLFSILLVAIGWHLYGPLSAYVIGIALSFCYGFFHIRDRVHGADAENSIKFEWNDFFSYAGKVLLIQVLISIITNGDILLVKYFFSDQDAGLYSSAMVVGKISMYAAMAIVAALFPMTMERVTKGVGTHRLLYKSLIYSGGIAILCALILNLFSRPVIQLLYGQQYIESASLLLPVSAFVLPVTLFTIMMNYQLATGQTRPLGFTLAGSTAVCGFFLHYFSTSISQMIYFIAAVLTLGVIIDIYIVVNQSQKGKNASVQ